MAEYKHFEIRPFAEVSILILTEPRLLRQELLDSLREELLRFVEEERPQKLVLFFGQVEYCTSAAISGLLSVKRRMADYGGELRLCELSEPVRDSFQRLGLSGTVFDVHDSIEDAVEAFEEI